MVQDIFHNLIWPPFKTKQTEAQTLPTCLTAQPTAEIRTGLLP